MSTANQVTHLARIFHQNNAPFNDQSLFYATYSAIPNKSTSFKLERFIEKIKKESKEQDNRISCNGSNLELTFGSTLRTISKVCHVIIHVLEIVDLSQARYETYKFQAKYISQNENIFLLYDAQNTHFDELYITVATDTKSRRVEYSGNDDLKSMFDQFFQSTSIF